MNLDTVTPRRDAAFVASALLRAKMSLRKRAAGTGLQVLLEANGRSLSRKLQDDYEGPWTMIDRMTTWPVVVPFQTPVSLAGDSDVVAGRNGVAPEDVDESLADASHAKS